MAGNNPRKFKDRIALLNQKQAESTEQFEKVMRDVESVRKPVALPFETGSSGAQVGGEALGIPRHHPHFRYGGSLPNVNQMSTGSSPDLQTGVQGLAALPPVSVPLEDAGYGGSGGGSPGYTTHPPSTSPGGGAIRTRISDRRWDNSPYGSDRNYYSSSLVSTYLSPPPESRWRRTHSDSALYQKLAAAQQQQAGGSGGASSEQGSPVQGSPVQDSREDVKPTSQELLNSLLSRDNGELVHTVKEEPGSPHSGLPTAGSPHSGGGGLNGHLENYSPPQLPPSPHSPVSPTLHRPQYLPPSGTSSPSSSFPINFPPTPQQSALEQEFSRFRLDPPPGQTPHYQDLGLMGRPQVTQEHNTGPTSPHTPTTLPDIYIQDYSQDWTQECEKGLLDRDFVDTLREGLEPIDDQLMAELTRTTGTFVDPAVEEQFKMNY